MCLCSCHPWAICWPTGSGLHHSGVHPLWRTDTGQAVQGQGKCRGAVSLHEQSMYCYGGANGKRKVASFKANFKRIRCMVLLVSFGTSKMLRLELSQNWQPSFFWGCILFGARSEELLVIAMIGQNVCSKHCNRTVNPRQEDGLCYAVSYSFLRCSN